MAQLDACPIGDQEDRQHSFVAIDHEIFSMVILSLLLFQDGQLSVSGERMCTILVNRLRNKASQAIQILLHKTTPCGQTLNWGI